MAKKKNKKRKKSNKKSKKIIRKKRKKQLKKINKRIIKLSKKSKKKLRKTKKTKSLESKELVFRVPKKWSSSAYVNKNQYEKNINYQLKIMKVFGKKKEKELIGLNLIQK